MTQAFRYVGNPDFHDGYVRQISRNQDQLLVTVEGSSGKRYAVLFEDVLSVDSETPQDMMLYALGEKVANIPALHYYEFLSWYGDEPKTDESKSYLRIVAKSFTVAECE